VAQLQVPASAAGYAELLTWASTTAGSGTVVWALEGTRHYGLGLARYLTAEGQQVAEIENTRDVGRRRAGKSDPIDAVRAARELLACPHPGQMRCDGDREALRLLMVDRDNAVHSRKTARTVLTSVIVTAPEELREQLRGLTRDGRARACARLACPPGADRGTRILHQTLIRLGQRITTPGQTAAGLEAEIATIVEDLAPGLVAAEHGVGALSAAQILLSWSHAGRIRSEAAFAMLSGTPRSPSPPAGPTATGSTASATASSTGPCTSSPSPACATTRRPLLTSSAAGPKPRPTKRSAAASSATSPATSTGP
jgi:transposase